jgi:1-acyl-sn-glycerol-3-phosphate acyltransferase
VSSGQPTIGHRPTDRDLEAARVLLAPWRWLTAPKFLGFEHVPRDRPFLLAGNHTLMAVLDAPLLMLEIHHRLRVAVRPIGDHLHFGVPLWRDLIARFGVVDGTRENVRALMRAGESLLVFPGGAREVFKRRGEKYRLMWGGRTGFARLAIEHGYPIVPFSAVGAEDVFDILIDADDMRRGPLGRLVRRLAPRDDAIPPVVRGVGLTALPRPERFYFRFAPPVDTAGRRTDTASDADCRAVRDAVRDAVEEGINLLLVEREHDPDRSVLARVLNPRR